MFKRLKSYRKGVCAVATMGVFIVLTIHSTNLVMETKITKQPFDKRMLLNDSKQTRVSQKTKPIYNITWYNPPVYHLNWPDALHCGFHSCEFSNCRMRIGKKHVTSSEAVIFDGRFLKPSDFYRRKPGQIWIFAAHEAPSAFNKLGGHWKRGEWVSSFNWTMTYDRSNTDIYLPYGEIRKTPDSIAKNFRGLFESKNKTALIVHSHCPTNSKREQFVSSLQKYLALDSFGQCGKPFKCGKRYKHDNCFDVINEYKFYFAFENAICDQYFTEKLFRNFNYDSIMVVRGGRNNDTKRALPGGTFISTDDFKSIASLAEYIKKVSESENMYTELLRRKSEYISVPYKVVYQRAMCDLCERMNKQDEYRKQISDIVEWAYGRKPCQNATDLIEK